ncbi:MAG TPA: two-component sensor histidine kinase, partial [Acidimicrobiaceae bacterium]|nr:two-component sensor histidine kinase [Acidimicrobiaceae bacterium]
MSLRLKIVALLAALAAAATMAIGVASYRSTSRELAQSVDRSLDDAARRFEDGRVTPIGIGTGGRPEPGRRQPAFEQVLWQVVTPDGTVLVSSGDTELPVSDDDLQVAAGDRLRARHDAIVDGDTFRVLTVPFDGGALMLARSLEESEEVTEAILRRTLSAVVVVVAITLVLGWLLARQITRRLERLTSVAGTVASTGRLDVEVPVQGADETGQLGRAFSGMLGALQRSRQEQRQLVQDAGHELRTPLTSVRTNVSVLRRRFDQLAPAEREQLLA